MTDDSSAVTDSDRLWDGLNERQIEAVSYRLLNPKSTYAEIEQDLGIPENTLQKWRLHQMADKIKENKLQATVDYMERLSIKAARVLEGQLDSDDERIAQSAAKDLLDRFMGKAKQSIDNNHSGSVTVNKGYVNISPDDWDGNDS